VVEPGPSKIDCLSSYVSALLDLTTCLLPDSALSFFPFPVFTAAQFIFEPALLPVRLTFLSAVVSGYAVPDDHNTLGYSPYASKK